MTQSTHKSSFIKEMEEKLLKEQQDLKAELGQLARKDKEDYQANYPDYGRHEDENASEIADFETLNETTEVTESRLKNVESALERIKEGTYGIAVNNGDTIPEDRLRANPAATSILEKK